MVSIGFDWNRALGQLGNTVSDIGYGLTQGNNIQSALKAAGERTSAMEQPRAQAELMQRQEQERQFAIEQQSAQRNQTVKWLMQNDMPDLAEAFSMGMVDANGLFQEIKARRTPAAPKPPMEINGQLVDPATYKVLGDYRNPQTPPEAPSGYRMTPSGGMEAIPGGPADPNNPLNANKTKGVNDLSATEIKQLFDTEETIQAANNVISALDTALTLNDKSRSGWGADVLSQIGMNVPDWVPGIGGNEATDANTMQLKNIVTEQALSQLKLIFGSMPTEGERAILLQIQGSVDQPAEVRQRIYTRAKELALARLKFNEQRKTRIETGGYGRVVQTPSGAPMPLGGAGVVDYTTYFGGQ